MMNLFKKQRSSSILGLALDGSRLDGVVLRRSNGSLHVQKTFNASLALNLLTGDPELVGREIRNHLDEAGIRERRCAVCLPLSWALTLQTKVPDLAETDVAGVLQIEAERGFPHALEALSLGHSRCRCANGEQYATLVAIPRNHLAALERILKAAQLKPVTFSLGIAALQRPGDVSSDGIAALALGESSAELQVNGGGGIVALRSLDSVFETEGVQQRLSADLLARELRITLGQLPAGFRDPVHEVRVFGHGESARHFLNEGRSPLAAMGLSARRVEHYAEDQFGRRLPPGTEVSPALSLAATWVTGGAPCLEFLPPKVKPWQRLSERYSSKKLVWAGATAGAAALVLAGALLFQQWKLSRLQTQWAEIQPKVEDLQNMQQQIKRFRPWFDDSHRILTILRKVTEAFPEGGSVTAKTLEIRDLFSVTCSGVARDNQAFLKMLDQLRATKEVADLKVDQVRGKTPLQFTFNFHWGAGGANEN